MSEVIDPELLARRIIDNLDNADHFEITDIDGLYSLQVDIRKDEMCNVKTDNLPDAFVKAWFESNTQLFGNIGVGIDLSKIDIPMTKDLEVETQPKKKKIKKKKQYRTRSGLPVEILDTRNGDEYFTVTVRINNGDDIIEDQFTKYGTEWTTEESDLDLIEITADSLELDDVIEVTWQDGEVVMRHATGQGGFFSNGLSSKTNTSGTPLNQLNRLDGYLIKSWKFISKFKQEEKA